MAKFSDPSYQILEDYFNQLIVVKTGTQKSYLIGPNHTVVSEGGVFTILYEKNADKGYVGHRFSILEIDGNRFIMKYIGVQSNFSISSDGGFNTSVNPLSNFEIGNEMYFRKDSFFHYWLVRQEQDDKWHDYVNQERLFTFFGKIWPSGDRNSGDIYSIEFEGLKDYSRRAIPQHNQTVNLTEWLKVYFDQVHHRMYNMTKTFWSLFDPREVDLRWLGYIANIYGIEINEELLDELTSREWVDNMPYFLKRVGTYDDIYVVWKLLAQNTINVLNVYERWGEWCTREIPGAVDDFDDHHFLEFYGIQPSGGAGDVWYSQYNPVNYPVHTTTSTAPSVCTIGTSGYPVMTSHYIVEVDLSSEPMGNLFESNFIMNEALITELIRNWEYVRPVSKYSHYHELIAPSASMQGSFSVPLYKEKGLEFQKGYMDTVFTGYAFVSGGIGGVGTEEYYTPSASSVWTISHSLSATKVLVQVWKNGEELVEPNTVEIIDTNTIQLTFNESIWGVATIASSAGLGIGYVADRALSNTWTVDHNLWPNTPSGSHYEDLQSANAVVQYWDANGKSPTGYMIEPDINKAVNDNQQEATWYINTAGSAIARRSDYVHTQNTPSTVWTVNHKLSGWVIGQAYNFGASNYCDPIFSKEKEEKFPYKWEIIDKDTCKLYWETEETGYVNLIYVPRSRVAYSGLGCDDIGLGICVNFGYWKVGNGVDSTWNPFIKNDLISPTASGGYKAIYEDANHWYVDFEVPEETGDLSITEVGLFNYVDDLMFYSTCTELFKPENVRAIFHYRILK